MNHCLMILFLCFRFPSVILKFNKLSILVAIDLLCCMNKFNSANFYCVCYSKVYGEYKSGSESVFVFKKFITWMEVLALRRYSDPNCLVDQKMGKLKNKQMCP